MNTDILIENNLKLVHTVCKKFTGRGFDYDDLYQIGCIGLIKAAKRFDESLGYKFSTYAVNLIIGEIRRTLRDNSFIKVSRILKENYAKIIKAQAEFEKENFKVPTINELKDITNLTEEEICDAINSNTGYISIYEKNEEDIYLLDTLTDKNSMKSFDKIDLEDVLSSLDIRSQKIIKLRYIHGKTQAEVAKIFNVSQAQISRIEKHAINDLQNMLNN